MTLASLLELPGASLDAGAWLALSPLLALAAGIVLLLVADLLSPPAGVRGAIVCLALGAALGCEWTIHGEPPGAVLGGSLLADRASAAWGALFLASTGLAWAFARRFYGEERRFLGEHDVLLLAACAGMMLMAQAQDLLVFFVGLELLSVPLYALAAFQRNRDASVEAGVKYFLLGAFAAALFLFGAALLYVASGSIELAALRAVGAGSPLALAASALVLASLFFKASIVPFHLWAPDVYQGSPTPVGVLMITGTKAAAFAFLLRAVFLLPSSAVGLLAALALATIALGNLGALVQTDLKRLLAYSGIAHAGTLLLAVTGELAGDPVAGGATRATLFYVATYVFGAGGAFGLIGLLEARLGRPVALDDLRGLASRRPAFAAALALFLLSLGGIPPTGGFFGKYLVFAVLVRADLLLVALLGVLLSVVALGYYLRVIVALYMQPSREPRVAQASLGGGWLAAACALVVLALGFLPSLLLERL